MNLQRYSLLVFCLAIFSILSQATPALADRRIALVIGNGGYKHTPALFNPPNDATDVAGALRAIGFDVTLKVDVEKRQMDQAIAQFAREGKTADAVLFYYAGHGMQFEGKNFIMPVDAELQDEVSLRYEMTAIDDVKSALELSPGVKIMVLDACRDNPLADRFVRSIRVSTRDVPKVQGYSRPEKTQGMIIVYATQADDVAQDGAGRNSPFSQAFLKEIKEPGLEVGAMFRRIGGDVYAATNGRQSPELSISMVPEYYLNQSETDQTIWARIRTSADGGVLREFLVRYPNSFYAPDARALLDLLNREARDKADREAARGASPDGNPEAARLREEQALSEQAAAEASARERAMAEKLAAAEAERTRLTKELAQRTADQTVVASDDRARRLQADADQVESLKAEIAQLEQQAAQAKTTAQSEVQRAEDAKKALAEKVASIAPSNAQAIGLASEQAALVAPIEAELRRIGCYAGADQDWDAPSVRLGVAEYARHAGLAATPTLPDATLLGALKGLRDGVCPPECSTRETLVNGHCVAERPPPSRATAAREPERRAAAPRKAAPREVARTHAPAKSGGRCFSFNGAQYCE